MIDRQDREKLFNMINKQDVEKLFNMIERDVSKTKNLFLDRDPAAALERSQRAFDSLNTIKNFLNSQSEVGKRLQEMPENNL